MEYETFLGQLCTKHSTGLILILGFSPHGISSVPGVIVLLQSYTICILCFRGSVQCGESYRGKAGYASQNKLVLPLAAKKVGRTRKNKSRYKSSLECEKRIFFDIGASFKNTLSRSDKVIERDRASRYSRTPPVLTSVTLVLIMLHGTAET